MTRLLVGYERKGRGLVTHRIDWLNGEPTIVTYAGEQVVFTTSVDTDGERIFAFYRVLDPEKLRRVGAR